MSVVADNPIAEIRAMLAQHPPTAGSFEDRRSRWEPLYTSICPVLPGTWIQPVDVAGLRAEWVCGPGVSPREQPVVLYIHGGGFTAGTVVAYRGLSSRYSAAANCRVLAFDYRLAPEQPFPAALEDSVKAYRWLIEENGIPSDRVALIGDSAGGNLVLAAMLQVRDSGGPLPRAAVCVSPVFDLALTGDSVTGRASRDPMILPESLRHCASAYLGGADPRTPLASPLYADLQSLPPLLIQVGSEEMLRDDSVRLAEKAKALGVEVTLEEWSDMIHVWHLFADKLSDGRAAITRVGEFLKQHLS